MKATPMVENGSDTGAPNASTSRIVGVAVIVTAAVAYQLYQTAAMTENYEGMWFSLAHTLLVAVGAIVALCGTPSSTSM